MISKLLYDVRPISNLKSMVEESEKLFGDKNAFLVKDIDIYKGISYSQFKHDMDALGTAMLELGLRNKFIAVISENRYEWCLSYIATVNGVGVAVPIDKELSVNEIENLLNRSNAAAVIFSNRFSESIKKVSKSCKSLEYLICMDVEQDEKAFLSLNNLIKSGQKLIDSGNTAYQDVCIDDCDLSVLLFTSGTTDIPKGVMLSHKNICSNIESVCSTVHIESTDSSLSILPLNHTYECTLGFLALIYNGCTISFNQGLRHIAKNLNEVKPTLFISVPIILENMYKKIWEQARKKKFAVMKLKVGMFISTFLYNFLKLDIRRKIFSEVHKSIGGNVRLILTGAAAIDPNVSKWFRQIGISVLQGYGLTECAPLVTGNRDKAFADGSAGLPIPGVEVKIDKPNKSGIGEIIVKGDNVMLGYFMDEEITQNSIRDGWFYTGDMGCIDKKGFLYITGRSKNVIVTKNGKKIFPEEVESYINKNPFVKESLVWGKYDRSTGETLVSAQVFPNFDAIKEKFKNLNLTKEELTKIISKVIKSVNRDMPLYKHIRHFSISESEFVKTTTNKIKRHAVKLT